nr:PTS sugar transporter subunit IIC [Spiroplasma clarkii]
MNEAIQSLPQWLMNVFKVSGNLLPGVGFAIILSIMMKKSYIPFALLGYFGTSYLGLGSIPLVILGVIVAAIILLVEKNNKNYFDEKLKIFK